MLFSEALYTWYVYMDIYARWRARGGKIIRDYFYNDKLRIILLIYKE